MRFFYLFTLMLGLPLLCRSQHLFLTADLGSTNSFVKAQNNYFTGGISAMGAFRHLAIKAGGMAVVNTSFNAIRVGYGLFGITTKTKHRFSAHLMAGAYYTDATKVESGDYTYPTKIFAMANGGVILVPVKRKPISFGLEAYTWGQVIKDLKLKEHYEQQLTVMLSVGYRF